MPLLLSSAFSNLSTRTKQLTPTITTTLLLITTAAISLLPAACTPQSGLSANVTIARSQQQAITAAAPAPTDEPGVGVAALADWDALPVLTSHQYQQFSSYNRHPGSEPFEPGGKDFNNFIAAAGDQRDLYLEQLDGPPPDDVNLGGYLLAAVDDTPGYVSRMFFTRFSLLDLLRDELFSDSAGLGRFDNEVLKIYIDDLTAPSVVIPLADLGQTTPFDTPFAGRNSAAVLSYTPISFEHTLRVVLGGTSAPYGYYYHINVQQISETPRPFTPRLAEDPDFAAAADLLTTFGTNPNTGCYLVVNDEPLTLPADTTTEIFSDETAGTLELLRFSFADPTPAALGALRLQVYYDSATQPAIDVPVDAFFGCRERVAGYRTLPMRVLVTADTADLACFLPMPYAESVRVLLCNDGTEPQTVRASIAVDRALPPEPWGYLHAAQHSVAGPQPAGSRFTVINIAGRGRYVGTWLFAAGNSDQRTGEFPASLNILEGNELGLIDGTAQILGTGTEDYYNGGFYFATGPVNHPFAAANYVHGDGADPGVVSCCRWHILADAIDFQESFQLSFQYGSDNPNLVVRYATVAYYYLNQPAPQKRANF